MVKTCLIVLLTALLQPVALRADDDRAGDHAGDVRRRDARRLRARTRRGAARRRGERGRRPDGHADRTLRRRGPRSDQQHPGERRSASFDESVRHHAAARRRRAPRDDRRGRGERSRLHSDRQRTARRRAARDGAAAASMLFGLGLQFAAPVVAAVLVANTALAILSRAAPQLNVLSVAFPIQIGIGLVALAAVDSVHRRVLPRLVGRLQRHARPRLQRARAEADDGRAPSRRSTEEATPKRRDEARNEGRIPRSQELTIAVSLLGSAASSSARSRRSPATRWSTSSAPDSASARRELDRAVGDDARPRARRCARSRRRSALIARDDRRRGVRHGARFRRAAPVRSSRSRRSSRASIRWRTRKNMLGCSRSSSCSSRSASSRSSAWPCTRAIKAALPDAIALSQKSQLGFLVRREEATRCACSSPRRLAYLALAARDYLWQWWQFEKSLRMTKEEVKQEMKQNDGDPHDQAASPRDRALVRAPADDEGRPEGRRRDRQPDAHRDRHQVRPDARARADRRSPSASARSPSASRRSPRKPACRWSRTVRSRARCSRPRKSARSFPTSSTWPSLKSSPS